MPDSKQSPIYAPLPGSLTDLAKALRELIGLVRDIAGLAGDSAHVLKKEKGKKVARSIHQISSTRRFEAVARSHCFG
jgi:hypothetical protein